MFKKFLIEEMKAIEKEINAKEDKMKTKDLELYYFGETPFQIIREKHLPVLKEIIGVKEFFNNENLNDDEFIDKQSYIMDKIYDYITSNKKIKLDFYNAYGVVLIDTLCQLVLEV